VIYIIYFLKAVFYTIHIHMNFQELSFSNTSFHIVTSYTKQLCHTKQLCQNLIDLIIIHLEKKLRKMTGATEHNFIAFVTKRIDLKQSIKATVILLAVLTVCLLCILYQFSKSDLSNSTWNTLKGMHEKQETLNYSSGLPYWLVGRHNTYGFHPVNDKGIYSFWNVCIEALDKPIQRSIEFLGKRIQFNETQKIVVYNSFYRDGLQKIYTSGSANSVWNHWDVFFSRDPIPNSHTFQTNTVYFVSPTCPANFHHFWIDEFVPLYSVIKQANKLRQGSHNQILYRRPSGLLDAETNACSNYTIFEPILSTLYANDFHDVFYRAKPGSCYSSAVFGTTPINIKKPREVVRHVLHSLNITGSRRRSPADYVTFIQRTNRLIGNIDELVLAAQSVGFRNVRIVTLEHLTAHEQTRIASSSRVMIGVQGAGLQWAVFMPAGSTLIEIAWPYKHWGFYFENYVKQYGIRHEAMIAWYVHANWTSYENFVRNGARVDVEERLQLLQQKPKSNSVDNIWKYADAWVNKKDFTDKLLSLELQPASSKIVADNINSYSRIEVS